MISFIIPHYNSAKLLCDCLRVNLNFFEEFNAEVIIVDNNSCDADQTFIKSQVELVSNSHIKILFLEKHSGVTYSLNFGYKFARFDFIARLDSDVVIDRNVFQSLINTLKSDRTIGCVGPRIILKSTNKSQSGVIKLGRFKNTIHETDATSQSDCIIGVLMLFKREAIESLDFWFNEKLFLWHEEEELCRRLNNRGYKCFYSPSTIVYHNHSITSGTNQHNHAIEYFKVKNMLDISLIYKDTITHLALIVLAFLSAFKRRNNGFNIYVIYAIMHHILKRENSTKIWSKCLLQR